MTTNKISELLNKISNFEMSETLKIFFTSEINKLDTENRKLKREINRLKKTPKSWYK